MDESSSTDRDSPDDDLHLDRDVNATEELDSRSRSDIKQNDNGSLHKDLDTDRLQMSRSDGSNTHQNDLNQDTDLDLHKDLSTDKPQMSRSEKKNQDVASFSIASRFKESKELLLEDYNTSDEDFLEEHKSCVLNTSINYSNVSEKVNQSDEFFESCDQDDVSKSSSVNRPCDEEDDQSETRTEESVSSCENAKNEISGCLNDDAHSKKKSETHCEFTPLEPFSHEDVSFSKAQIDADEMMQNVKNNVGVHEDLDKHANKENIILVKRIFKNSDINPSQKSVDNLSKKRSGTPFVQSGSVNLNNLVNNTSNVENSKHLSELDCGKDSGIVHRSDSKRSTGSVKKVPISSRVELMLSNDLFKKYVGKHQGLLERISQRQGRGRQSGLKKTFSNLDLSNLDLDQEFNSPFTPSFDKQTHVKDKPCEKSASFTGSDIKNVKHCEKSKRRLSLAGDKDLQELQNVMDKREEFLKEIEAENASISNRKFKFCIPSFEDFKRHRKAKLISSQKFVKEVLTNDRKTKAAVSLSESKFQNLLETKKDETICEEMELPSNSKDDESEVNTRLTSSPKFVKDELTYDSKTKADKSLSENEFQNLLETKNGGKICEKEDLLFDTEEDKPQINVECSLPFKALPCETLPFEVVDCETLESVDNSGIYSSDKINNRSVETEEISKNSARLGDKSLSEISSSVSSENYTSTLPVSEKSNIESEWTDSQSSVLDNVDAHLCSATDVSGKNDNVSTNSQEMQTSDKLSENDQFVPMESISGKPKSKLPVPIQSSVKSSQHIYNNDSDINNGKINTVTANLHSAKIDQSAKPSQNQDQKLKSVQSADSFQNEDQKLKTVHSSNLSQNSEEKSKERIILRASRKRKISSRKKDVNSDVLSNKKLQPKFSKSLSVDSYSANETSKPCNDFENSSKTKKKIPFLSVSSLSSDSEVFPEPSPGLAGTFIFPDNSNSPSLSESSMDKISIGSSSDQQPRGDNSSSTIAQNLTSLSNDNVHDGLNKNNSQSEDRKYPEFFISDHCQDNTQEILLKNSVMRSTSDVTDSTPDAHRKRRERKERPYKSDPFTGGPKIPAAGFLYMTGKQRSSSSLKEDFLDFTDDTSLEEVNEEEDSNISESESENGMKMRNRLSNLSNASSDSGVNGLPDVSCDLALSPNASESSLFNLFNSKNDDVVSTEDKSNTLKSRNNRHSFDGSECSLCKQSNVTVTGESSKRLLCMKCNEKLKERKETIMEIKDTEISYGRDLKILKEEFYKPMRSAGLLSAEQLESIFLNLEELIEVNNQFSEKLEQAVLMSEQNGNQDLLTVNIGHLFIESTSLILAFDNYCVNQGSASILLEQLEKEKEILRIFLKVSQDENSLLRRMHLKSFLMVPVQRITRYPLLLDRLHKLTPDDHEDKDTILEAKSKIETILGHINAKTKQGGTIKVKRKNAENHRITVTEKLEVNRAAIEVLGWNKKEVCDVITSRLLVASQSEQNWASKRMKSFKFTQVHGVLLTLGQCEDKQKGDDRLLFPKKTEVIQAAVVLIKEKNGKYQTFREPFMLNRCVVNVDPDTVETFELMELNKEPFLFRGEDSRDTKLWLQNVKQQTLDLGTWRRRRNALPNIMMKHIV